MTTLFGAEDETPRLTQRVRLHISRKAQFAMKWFLIAVLVASFLYEGWTPKDALFLALEFFSPVGRE